MGRYRKKPVVIDAIQWSGSNWHEALDFCLPFAIFTVARGEAGMYLAIETLEGRMEAAPGDMVIKGVKGEVYPCKPDIFEATYEAVE